MKKKYNLKRIKNKRSYSLKELAETVEVHIRTVQGWRREGMSIVPGSSPFLVMGSAVRAFIRAKQAKRRVCLGAGQFYCLSCKKAVSGAGVQSVVNPATIGKGMIFYTLRGRCVECGGIVNRFSAVPESSQNVFNQGKDSSYDAVR